MRDLDRKPFVSEGLLEYLGRLFPDKAPELKDTDREIWFHRGAAEVIRHLQRLNDDQQENILGSTNVL